MAASASLGMREIIITAHHEGGFALWPSKFTPYSVKASSWKGGKGDVLREFADAANKWGIKIGYYLNVQDDGYMNFVANYTCEDFVRRQVGMVTEVLTEYGPVNRFWFDGTSSNPCPTTTNLWEQVIRLIGAEGLDRRGPAGSCRPFLGHGFRLGARWNRLVETVKTRKKTGKNRKKIVENG